MFPTLQSAWRQAQADVRQREAAVAKAEADVSRVRDLLANRAIAQKEVLVVETDLAVATAALEQARATRRRRHQAPAALWCERGGARGAGKRPIADQRRNR